MIEFDLNLMQSLKKIKCSLNVKNAIPRHRLQNFSEFHIRL
jgi:hypothetical protein